jgi:chromate transporter
VPFLYGETVQTHGWLTEREFVDAIAVSMITPGPVVITVAFIGFLVLGLPGAFAAAAGIFLPIWISVAVLAPYYQRIQNHELIRHFVTGITAAVSGALAGAVCVLAVRTITDAGAVGIALGTLLVTSKPLRLPEPLAILIAALIGLTLRGS